MGRTVRRDGKTWTCDWATQVGIPAPGRPIPPGARARVRCTSGRMEVVFTAALDWESWADERLRAEIDKQLSSDRH